MIAKGVVPLGFFGSSWPLDDRARAREVLAAMPKEEDLDLCEKLASYLRGATMILAWMEYTTDLLDDNYGVSGGSAVMSDGTYFWRFDTAHYVEKHAIALDPDFVGHVRKAEFVPTPLDETERVELEKTILDAKANLRKLFYRGT